MSTYSLTTSFTGPKTLVNQGLSTTSVRLNRRGRLARTLVVLSLAIVLAAVFSARSGAGTASLSQKSPAHSYLTVTVAPGETLWNLSNRLADGGDVRGLVEEIISVNSLTSVDLTAGQKLRIPLT